jgi:membrane protease YdiL (CAAX protease family)
MGKGLSYLEILKALSIIALLALPPWFVFRKYVRHRIGRPLLILMFIGYIGITIFTEQLMPFIIVIFIFIFMKSYRGEDETLYYLRPLGNKKLEIVLYAIVFNFLVRIINALYVLILNQIWHFEPKSQEIMDLFMKGNWVTIIILSAMTVITAPVLEEFIFRHIIYRGFAGKTGKIAAALISTILFTLLHYNLTGAVSFFAVGAYNCYLYEKYGYRAAVINHFVFNFSSTVLIIGLKLFNINAA